jgi:hypothetical protein
MGEWVSWISGLMLNDFEGGKWGENQDCSDCSYSQSAATVAYAMSWSWVACLNVPCSSIIWVITGRDLYRVDHRLVQLCVRELICFTISSPDGHGDWVGGKVRWT